MSGWHLVHELSGILPDDLFIDLLLSQHLPANDLIDSSLSGHGYDSDPVLKRRGKYMLRAGIRQRAVP